MTKASQRAAPRVTLVVVPRERFSVALRSLASLYADTDAPFDLVYVDGGAPPRVRDELRAAARRYGFTLLRSERYLSPNQARNLGLAHVRTPYVVFVDNDVFVTPGWLSRLLACADETGAAIVAPLALEGGVQGDVVHNAGGFFRFVDAAGGRDLVQDTPFKHARVSELPRGAVRRRVDYVELHCALVRRDLFDRVGPFDEALLSSREHLDLCLRAGAADLAVWVEGSARVAYDNPPPVRVVDVPYFLLRWSEAWNDASLERFARKYDLGPLYVARARWSNNRRRALFAPVRGLAERALGAKRGRWVGAALAELERVTNVVVVGRLARALASHAPRATSSSPAA